jgi:hypothetical protein
METKPAVTTREPLMTDDGTKIKDEDQEKDGPDEAKSAAELADEEPLDQSVWESVWDHDSPDQPEDAPDGTYQRCYWTDGMIICREKTNGVWRYWCVEE